MLRALTSTSQTQQPAGVVLARFAGFPGRPEAGLHGHGTDQHDPVGGTENGNTGLAKAGGRDLEQEPKALRLPTWLPALAAKCTWVRCPDVIPSLAIPSTARARVPCQRALTGERTSQFASEASLVTGVPSKE